MKYRLRGASDVELGKDGSKWKHDYIPLNAAAVALKAHKHPGSVGAATPGAVKFTGREGNRDNYKLPSGHDVSVHRETGRVMVGSSEAIGHPANAGLFEKKHVGQSIAHDDHHVFKPALSEEAKSRPHGSVPFFDPSTARLQKGHYANHSLEAASHLQKFQVGDKVILKDEQGRHHLTTVNRSGRGDGNGFGSAESHSVGASLGPGRYTYDVHNWQLSTGKLNIRHATAEEIRHGGVLDTKSDPTLTSAQGAQKQRDLLEQAIKERQARDAATSGVLSHAEVEALSNRRAQLSRMNSIDKRATNRPEESIAARNRELGQINRKLKKHYAARDAAQTTTSNGVTGSVGNMTDVSALRAAHAKRTKVYTRQSKKSAPYPRVG